MPPPITHWKRGRVGWQKRGEMLTLFMGTDCLIVRRTQNVSGSSTLLPSAAAVIMIEKSGAKVKELICPLWTATRSSYFPDSSRFISCPSAVLMVNPLLSILQDTRVAITFSSTCREGWFDSPCSRPIKSLNLQTHKKLLRRQSSARSSTCSPPWATSRYLIFFAAKVVRPRLRPESTSNSQTLPFREPVSRCLWSQLRSRVFTEELIEQDPSRSPEQLSQRFTFAPAEPVKNMSPGSVNFTTLTGLSWPCSIITLIYFNTHLMLLPILCLIGRQSSTPYSQLFNLFPRPANSTHGASDSLLVIEACSLSFSFQRSGCLQVDCPFYELLKHYQQKHFRCSSFLANPKIQITITCLDPRPKFHFKVVDEAYKLSFSKDGRVHFSAESYYGIVRAFESFAQLFTFFGKRTRFAVVRHLPLELSDYPAEQFRGVLVDAASRFLPLWLLKQTIDGMMYSKLNVLTLNLLDDHSLRVRVPLQNLPKSQPCYQDEQLKELLVYGLIRGVMVIPRLELFTSKYFKTIPAFIPLCTPQGMLDPSLPQVEYLYRSIFAHLGDLFLDYRVNVGRFSSATLLLKRQNVFDDQRYSRLPPTPYYIYLHTTKDVLSGFNRKLVLEGVEDELEKPASLGLGDEFVLLQNQLRNDQSKLGRIILSPTGLDLGAGALGPSGEEGVQFSVFMEFFGVGQGSRVVGGQCFLLGDNSNKHSHTQKVFMRAAAMSEVLWNRAESTRSDRVRRLIFQQKQLEHRGLLVSPLTGQQCQADLAPCFS